MAEQNEESAFIPVFESMIKDVGLVTAAVYGEIWRYCQMSDHVCYISQLRMGDELGLNRRTMIRHLKKLVDLGFITDMTPGRRNMPHVYKLKRVISTPGVTESHTKNAGAVTESPSGMPESHTGVTESHMNRQHIDNKRQQHQVGESRNGQRKLDAVVAFGVAPNKKVKRLLKKEKIDLDYIEAAISYARYKDGIRDRPAFLVGLLESDWQPPKNAFTPEQIKAMMEQGYN